MNSRERFQEIMNFKSTDWLQVMEWICWWDKTIDRWLTEGFPDGLGREDILREFGIDVHEWVWLTPRSRLDRLPNRIRSQGIIDSEADYDRLAAPMDKSEIDKKRLKRIAAARARGKAVVWLQFDGFFWFQREIFGVEQHLFAFFDQPKLLHRINDDLCCYNLACLEEVLTVLTPDVMTFAEDLSYSNGAMLSRNQFDEFITPYYQRIVPLVKKHGIIPMVDTDGDVSEVIPWLQDAGIEGCLPLERMAGVDVAEPRRCHPTWRMIGGFDKTIMHSGEDAIRKEFERLLPVMQTSGYIPPPITSLPPDVNLNVFYDLKEYCSKAVSKSGVIH